MADETTRGAAWATAMDAPSVAWAAADLFSLVRRVDDAAGFIARMHGLLDRAGDADLARHAATAHNALWALTEGMAAVAHQLEDEGEADRG